MFRLRTLAGTLVLLGLLAQPIHAAMSRPSVAFTLHIPEPATHMVEVEALYPAPPPGRGREQNADLELMMAVWTPGSYLVREYARHVEAVRAELLDGTPLAVEKTAKNRWRVAAGGQPARVRYRLYCHELTVRTNFVDQDLALLNGAATYLVPAGPEGPSPASYQVRLELPEGWARSATSLDPITPPGAPAPNEPHAYFAADFHTLVDSPIYAGDGALYGFDVDGVPHRVLSHGEAGPWEGEKAVSDVAKIVRAQRAFWGELPYQEFLFLNLIVEARGGLEHAESTVLMTSRWKMGTRKGYLEWLGLVAHELFHAWNVKRLRPAELATFDYEREVYTRNLWIVEGFTSYYDDLMVHRAGLSTRDEALAGLSHHIKRLQTTPGRKVQPVDLASFDAWIKLYRPDESSVNTAVSYYTKGAVVAFLLDTTIRRYTDGRQSLDDALRLAWQRFASGSAAAAGGAGSVTATGFTDPEFRKILEETAGRSLDALLDRALTSTEELDYSQALEWYGLRFATPEVDPEDENEETAGWLGVQTASRGGRLVITQVPRGTPAYEGGLNVDDEILAIDRFRIPAGGIDERLKAFRPGQHATVTVARRERLIELPVTLGEEPQETWKLEVDPEATAEQRAHLEAWLGRDGD